MKKDDAQGLAALLDNLDEGENWEDHGIRVSGLQVVVIRFHVTPSIEKLPWGG